MNNFLRAVVGSVSLLLSDILGLVIYQVNLEQTTNDSRLPKEAIFAC